MSHMPRILCITSLVYVHAFHRLLAQLREGLLPGACLQLCSAWETTRSASLSGIPFENALHSHNGELLSEAGAQAGASG